jgi:hypothetical protein
MTVTCTAAQYFSDGIKAHMDQMATYDAASAVSPSAATAYIAANPLSAGAFPVTSCFNQKQLYRCFYTRSLLRLSLHKIKFYFMDIVEINLQS